MRKCSIRGYLLEEVLANLTMKTGYKIFTDSSQDKELKEKRGDLWIKGRGGDHQVDVLGELEWIPAFTLPLRLIIEAKYYTNKKVGVDVVRNSIGVLRDVNQKYLKKDPTKAQPRFRYVYSIFSASGFSSNAQKYAFTHKISLIDLNSGIFQKLTDSIKTTARELKEEMEEEFSESVSKKKLRKACRNIFGTKDIEGNTPSYESNQMGFKEVIKENLLETVEGYGNLFIGVVKGPFILLLKEKEKDNFLDFAKEKPNHRVKIKWDTEERGKWYIIPYNENEGYRLNFKLPEKLHKWVFGKEKKLAQQKRNAMDLKKRYMSDINVYYFEEDTENLNVFNLKFDPQETEIEI
ncbi:MAG: Endonuclease HJR/Mrr/RecB family [Candidatus Methanohalarchaeum thermophilum]|uniref:Endonuclease HJR/Mrr/RecB family n=1 Tax=Methanohalarchaeum thermophilum TaxID=1903181 RepID=A0A1Q6DRV3_METT1|nr:MAG: Endonuclease HJR/Mrr/RecB family [Candidatus Methanohalarchaeum thermophilum]